MKKYFYIFLSIFVVFLIKATSIPSPVLSYRIPISSSSSTLNTSLISYWKLDEASGTRVDSEPTGTARNLTDNNTVDSTNGIISNAALVIRANSESLSVADNVDLSVGIGESFSISAWVWMVSTNTRNMFVTKTSSLGDEYGLEWHDVGQWHFWFCTNGSQYFWVTNATQAANATWFHLAASFNAGTKAMSLSVNAGTAATWTQTTSPDTGGAPFYIGAYRGVGGGGIFQDGRIDEVGFWKKVLSASEITELYNSGSGKTCCPF